MRRPEHVAIFAEGWSRADVQPPEKHRALTLRLTPSLPPSRWNWADAYLRVVLGAGTPRYRFLRQALMARRALLLLDGLDEGSDAQQARLDRLDLPRSPPISRTHLALRPPRSPMNLAPISP